MGRDKIHISNAKKDLSHLTDTLINEVNIRITEAPDIVDLKREQDYLFQHAINVAALAILIGQSMQYHQLKLFDLAQAALLADFGMQYIDKAVLLKADALTEEETEKMQKHTMMGFQHLGRNCFIKGLITIVALQHHERWDGSGYLKNMVREEIHEYSAIIALADVFDAYTSDRPWRRMHTVPEAVAFIKENENVLFDPRIVRHFLRFYDM
jgi:HD-GYP domain-containing protein (c-di-GMP phosphodiesterase class II)